METARDVEAEATTIAAEEVAKGPTKVAATGLAGEAGKDPDG